MAKTTQVVSFTVMDKEPEDMGIGSSKIYYRQIKTTGGVFLTLTTPDPRVTFLNKGDFCSLEGRVYNDNFYVLRITQT